MNRDEEIRISAREAANKVNGLAIEHEFGFQEGAKWADNNPQQNWIEYSEKYKNAIDALKEIESGAQCSACSCNCHRVASHALTLTK